jgi:hypothetical protein
MNGNRGSLSRANHACGLEDATVQGCVERGARRGQVGFSLAEGEFTAELTDNE